MSNAPKDARPPLKDIRHTFQTNTSLNEKIKAHTRRPSILRRIAHEDRSGRVSQPEFEKALVAFGYRLSGKFISVIFGHNETNSSKLIVPLPSRSNIRIINLTVRGWKDV
jgi:hypothetical protein